MRGTRGVGAGRRKRTASLLALALLAACGPQPARNVVLVSIDTLRADTLGAYGHPRPTSPNIDGFAGQGTLVELAWSSSPWTLPAHASLLSGLYPSRHGVRSVVLGLPDEVEPLASRLAEAGFRTAGIVNSQYLTERYGFDRGFDEFVYVKETEDRAAPSEVLQRILFQRRRCQEISLQNALLTVPSL